MKYESIAQEIAGLLEEKNLAYGDSLQKSGSVLAIMFPGGVPSEKLWIAGIIVRIIDKLFRLATDETAFGEEPLKDIAGYAILGLFESRKRQTRA